MNELSINETLLIWINQDWANPAFDIIFEWLSSKWGFSLPLLVVIMLLIGRRYGKPGWILSGLIIVVTSLSDLIGNFLKDIFQHARPCLEMYELIRFPDGSDTQCESSISGMPSNHAMNFFATFSFICYFFPRRWIILVSLIISILVSISRIYLGEHYPVQVLVGAIFGAILGLTLAVLSFKGLKRKLNFYNV